MSKVFIAFFAALLLLAGVFAQGGVLGPSPVKANPGGKYTVTLKCGTHTASISQLTLTLDNVPVLVVGAPLPSCTSGNSDSEDFTYWHEWNDLKVTYVCDAGASTVLDIPPASMHLSKSYTLTCPSPGGTHGPAGGDPPGDATVTITGPAGGLAELPDVAGDSGSSTGTYAALAGGLAAALLALGAGAWYARRRLSR